MRILPLLLLAFVVGCGGGGGGGGPTIRGTAASGAPLPGATIEVKDATGELVTGTTAPDGTYSVPVGGMTGPFLIECDDGAGTVLFSIRPDPGIANVTPYTDLVISSYYAVHDITLDDAFFDAFQGPGLQGGDPVPTALDIQAIASLVEGVCALWLQQEGVDPDEFDLITTPFSANGTGYDGVLDNTTVTGSDITITDGSTTTNATIDAQTDGSITIDATTTSGKGTTTTTTSTFIPTSSTGQSDLAGAIAAVNAFAAELQSQGSGIVAADITPYLDPSFLDDGRDATIWAAEAATFSRNVTLSDFDLVRVVSVDDVNHIVDAEFSITESAGGQSSTDTERFVLRKVGNAFLFYGNQRVADVEVQLEARTDSLPSGTTNVTSINVDVSAPTGTVNDTITVTGGPFSATPVPKSPGTRTDVLEPTPTTTLDFVQDAFFANSGDVTLPASGTLFQFLLTPTGGSQVQYDVVGNAATEEHIAVTSPTGHALANANLGGTLTVQWTLPTTYAVQRVQLSGHVRDAMGNQLQIEGLAPILAKTATSGQIQLPTQWTDGGGTHTVVEASINVGVNGTNGERSMVIYVFQ